MPETRQAIVEEDRLPSPADRGRPDVERLEAERRLSPCGRALADQARIGPSNSVRRGLDPDRSMGRALLSGTKCNELAVNLDDLRIVDARVARHLRLRLGRPQRCGEKKDERQRPGCSFSPNSAHS